SAATGAASAARSSPRARRGMPSSTPAKRRPGSRSGSRQVGGDSLPVCSSSLPIASKPGSWAGSDAVTNGERPDGHPSVDGFGIRLHGERPTRGGGDTVKYALVIYNNA